MINDLNKHQRIIHDWQYGRMGDFYKSLMTAISLADVRNAELLSRAYPDHVEAFELFSIKEGWWQEAEELAESK